MQIFGRKRANALQILLISVQRACKNRPTSTQKLGRRALRNTHDVGAALSQIIGSFGIEIARLRRSKSCKFSRERAANFIRFRCNAHAKLGRRAPQTLCNMHEVGADLSRITVLSGMEIARLRRSKSCKFSRENARTRCKFCSISVQRACKTRPACAACVAQHSRRR